MKKVIVSLGIIILLTCIINEKLKRRKRYLEYEKELREKKVDPIKIDSTKFTLSLLEYAQVEFPEVHILINFKESSACKGIDSKNKVPTLCSSDWEDIIGFNFYNYSGVKHPRYRKTTSIGSIGDVYQSLLDQGFRLPDKYQYLHYHLLNNEHAVYTSPLQHAIDLRYRQQYFYSVLNLKPKRVRDYIEFLKESKYNPYDHYYNDPVSGLYSLLNQWQRGEFQKKYSRYFKERMQIALIFNEPLKKYYHEY